MSSDFIARSHNNLRKGNKVKVKSAYEPNVAHQAGAYLIFCGMKRLGVFLLPPEWDASPSQGYPHAALNSLESFIHLGGDKHRES